MASSVLGGDKNELNNLAVAFAGARQFLLQPRTAQTLQLLVLVKDVGDLQNIRLENTEGVLPVFSFEVRDSKDGIHRYRCNPVTLAVLILVVAFGQSIFVNFTGRQAFLKACGRSFEKAGFVVARLIRGAEARLGPQEKEPGEKVLYIDSDCLNLTHENLKLAADPRSKAGSEHWYGEVLAYAPEVPDALLPGLPKEKADAAKDLWQLALNRLAEEREVAKGTA